MTNRPGLTLVESLVAIGIVVVTLSLSIPAIQRSREAARRTVCANHLRQIGIGLQHYHAALSQFPVGCVEWRGLDPESRQLAWSAYLLPFVEQPAVFDAIDFAVAFDDDRNQFAASQAVAVYRCPSSTRVQKPRERALSDFGGIYGERITGPNNPAKGTMLIDRSIRGREITDGWSYTAMVAEDTRSKDGQWINGNNIFDQAFPINSGPAFENDIRSEHLGGANIQFCDGSTQFYTNSTSLSVLAALCTRSGGELDDHR